MRTLTRALSTLSALALSAALVTGCTSAGAAGIGIGIGIDAGSTGRSAGSDEPSADGRGRYAEINGLRLYYETHGTGEPLVLIHGGLNTIDSAFAALLPELAETRQVIAVELQAHGHTVDIDRPMRYELMADDVAGLVTHLGLGKTDVLGYSLGGGVALQLASRNPDLVQKLVVVSAPFQSAGWTPAARAGMAAMNADALLGTPVHEAYTKASPKPEGWTALVDKTRQLLTEDYDWTSEVASITAPALLLVAESDSVLREHAVALASVLGSGATAPSGTTPARLEIIPGATHYDIMYRADLLLPLVTPFLDAPAQATASVGAAK
ncbi:alpha/beta fold hydrolase [Rhodococcus sp. NPDC059234]|uniref:alpha/beta fold hydrolase n=1 Tax=Rhodococcus sp. NPDC059234 TaxID=3346781 RepID=UPI00366C89ED